MLAAARSPGGVVSTTAFILLITTFPVYLTLIVIFFSPRAEGFGHILMVAFFLQWVALLAALQLNLTASAKLSVRAAFFAAAFSSAIWFVFDRWGLLGSPPVEADPSGGFIRLAVLTMAGSLAMWALFLSLPIRTGTPSEVGASMWTAAWATSAAAIYSFFFVSRPTANHGLRGGPLDYAQVDWATDIATPLSLYFAIVFFAFFVAQRLASPLFGRTIGALLGAALTGAVLFLIGSRLAIEEHSFRSMLFTFLAGHFVAGGLILFIPVFRSLPATVDDD